MNKEILKGKQELVAYFQKRKRELMTAVSPM